MLLVSEGMEQASESGEERPVESDHSEFDVELSGDEDSEDIAGRIPTARLQQPGARWLRALCSASFAAWSAPGR